MFMDYWLRLLQANPKLNDDAGKITLSMLSFRREIEKAYKAGQADRPGPPKRGGGPLEDMMRDFLGM